MSSDDTFLSWANWVKDKLATDNVQVNVEYRSGKNLTAPYLFLQAGPEIPLAKEWRSGMIVQAWFVCERVEGEAIEVTSGRLYSQITAALRDPGLIAKYDYSGAEPVLTNKCIEQHRTTGAPSSGNENRSQRSLVWEIYANN